MSQWNQLIAKEPSPFVRNPAAVSAAQATIFSEFRDLALSAYLERTPFAQGILTSLKKDKAPIINDHIALRTFRQKDGTSGKDAMEKLFLAFGYKKENEIQIGELFLICHWYEPPQSTNWPKVFISEQQVDMLPEEAARIVHSVVGTSYSKLKVDVNSAASLFAAIDRQPWNISSRDYDKLISLCDEFPKASGALQYAAWTCVNAHRWNHFTILLNTLGLPSLRILEDLNERLKKEGYKLNKFGASEIQGTAEKHLKQSSTVANLIPHVFADGVKREVPGAFVEFIERFVVDGEPMRGFLPGNALGIFGSTNVKPAVKK